MDTDFGHVWRPAGVSEPYTVRDRESPSEIYFFPDL